jgi:hypothetical protein
MQRGNNNHKGESFIKKFQTQNQNGELRGSLRNTKNLLQEKERRQQYANSETSF